MVSACIVGALACHKDSYLQRLETKVISCTKSVHQISGQPSGKSKSRLPTPPDVWFVEFEDSVLFPEGGGQPSDHGVLYVSNIDDSIPITTVQRQGLRCICHSPQPLDPGTVVRQELDFKRRWDHMQQHTGQHLLSAIAANHLQLKTLGWGMGQIGDQCYVDLPRKPSDEEIRILQERCNDVVQRNLSITVEIPEDANVEKLPGDYDLSKGVIRVIHIGDIDANTCCGTHLSHTSELSLILVHASQPTHSTNHRLYFSVGDRAIKLATSSIQSLRSVARVVSSAPRPEDIISTVTKTSEALSELKKKEKKLLSEIAVYEGSRVRTALENGKNALVYRATDGLEFLNAVGFEVKDVTNGNHVLVLASGEENKQGQVVIVGGKSAVDSFSAQALQIISGLKGGGRGERWQGKVVEWKRGELEALKSLVNS